MALPLAWAMASDSGSVTAWGWESDSALAMQLPSRSGLGSVTALGMASATVSGSELAMVWDWV
jgi:hypothetical protein